MEDLEALEVMGMGMAMAMEDPLTMEDTTMEDPRTTMAHPITITMDRDDPAACAARFHKNLTRNLLE